MQIVIDIPEEAKQAFDCAESNDLKGSYYDHGGIIGNAIKNGRPLNSVLNEIREELESQRKEVSTKNSENAELQAYYHGLNDGLKDARDTLDKHKSESEEEDG